MHNRKSVSRQAPSKTFGLIAATCMVLMTGCRADLSIAVQPLSPLAAPALPAAATVPTTIAAPTAVQEQPVAAPAPIAALAAPPAAAATPVVMAPVSPLAVPAMPSRAVLTFSDQTDAAGVAFTHATPITAGDGAQMISGAAAGDFDNDGWVDLYMIGGGLRADALFINQQDGTFVDMAERAGLAAPHLGSGAAVGDYDGDGWLDLYVTSFGTPDDMAAGRHRLYRNNGDLTFTDVAAEAGVNLASPELPDGLGAAFGDYDLDGELDLFVAGWRKPDGEPALGNRLFRNNGDGTFAEVTAAAGIVDDGIRGFNPCFADMDGDRYPELLLGADFGTSRYFRNNGDGSFSDITAASGANITWSGMGSAVGDVNNDGRLDWFITAIFDDDAVGRGVGNTLYLNQGGHQFVEIAAQAGVADGGWGWGTDIVDFNNDTLPDIAAVNGWDLESYVNERGKFWLQAPDGSFQEVAEAVGFSEPMNQLGLLTLDYDNDGAVDIVTTSFNDGLRLYRNDLAGEDAHWLRVLLDTQGAPRLAPNGSGAQVQVRIGDQTLTRAASNCAHYLTQSEMALHFGLGAATQIDELTVTWSDGATTTLHDVPADQTITVKP